MRRAPASHGKSAIVTAVAVALCLVPATVAAPPPSAAIVEGVSMGKVRLLMNKSAVVAAFGTPAWCFNPSSKDDQECDWLAPPDKKIKGLPEPLHTIGAVSVRFWKGKAVEIHLMAPDRTRPEYRNVPLLSGWKTTKGIGLGSSAASLRAAYGHGLTQQSYPAGVRLKLISKRGGRRVETWFEVGPSASSVWEIIVLTPGR
jgi:hypothetical protein